MTFEFPWFWLWFLTLLPSACPIPTAIAPTACTTPEARTAPPAPALMAGIAGNEPKVMRIALNTLMAWGCSLVRKSSALVAFRSQAGACVAFTMNIWFNCWVFWSLKGFTFTWMYFWANDLNHWSSLWSSWRRWVGSAGDGTFGMYFYCLWVYCRRASGWGAWGWLTVALGNLGMWWFENWASSAWLPGKARRFFVNWLLLRFFRQVGVGPIFPAYEPETRWFDWDVDCLLFVFVDFPFQGWVSGSSEVIPRTEHTTHVAKGNTELLPGPPVLSAVNLRDYLFELI